LFAISIFSLIAVGGISIMNKGNAVTQRALEITLVRQQIDSQAEILRFLNSSYIKAFDSGASIDSYGAPDNTALPPITAKPAYWWASMTKEASSSGYLEILEASDFSLPSSICPAFIDNSFIFNTKTTELVKLTTSNFLQPSSFSQLRFDIDDDSFVSSDGLWIEAVRSDDGVGDESGLGYIDFHIRACWPSVGQEVPMTIGTIVRLYEPR
jgi:hypothetical protein